MIDKFTLEIKVGDKVETGRFHLANQEIKAIEIDKWGHPVLTLESGRKKGVIPEDVVRKQQPADIMLTKEQWAEAEKKISEARSK